jgi:hypothetical protein
MTKGGQHMTGAMKRPGRKPATTSLVERVPRRVGGRDGVPAPDSESTSECDERLNGIISTSSRKSYASFLLPFPASVFQEFQGFIQPEVRPCCDEKNERGDTID